MQDNWKLDPEILSQVLAEHEIFEHQVPKEEIITVPHDCLEDVKLRYDAEVDKKLRPPGYPYGEFDATKWAAEFKRIFPDSDEHLMIGWFSNAIMTGFDKAKNDIPEVEVDEDGFIVAPGFPEGGLALADAYDGKTISIRSNFSRINPRTNYRVVNMDEQDEAP